MSGAIFISYRRSEARDIAGRLADRLMAHFGDDQVFLDVETIEPGVDFVNAIEKAVTSCHVLIVVIGPDWVTLRDPSGRRRLDDPYDALAIEVRTAFSAGVRVIPVLVNGAYMPHADDLPEDLKRLARINGARLEHDSFRGDAQRLIGVIERALGAAGRTTSGPPKSLAPVIVPGRSVRGIEIGASQAEVQRVIGNPEDVSRFAAKATDYYLYPAQGLEIGFREGRLSTFFLYAAGPARATGGGRAPAKVYRAFVGSTPEGISVGSTRAQVEATYGPAEMRGAPTLDGYSSYPGLGLSFCYATRDPYEKAPMIYYITVSRPR